MPTIEIIRSKFAMGVFRLIKVKVNSDVVGSIKFDTREVFAVATGQSDVQVSMDWVRSNVVKLDLLDGDQVTL